MKRVALVAILLVGAVAPLPAGAGPGHERPKITRFEFTDKPLKAGMLERVVVVAHDPDSWITEIQLRWEDESRAGGVIFAHTYCLQDPEFENPGTPAKLKLDVQFEHPGTYHVEVRALSAKRCDPSRDPRTSRTLEKDVVVRDPHKAFADPDDTVSPLDILSAEQNQVADEAALPNLIVHEVVFSDDLGEPALAGGGNLVRLFFDVDRDGASFERYLTIDDTGGGLTAEMHDTATNERIGTVSVSAEGSRLRVQFPRRLLGKNIDSYGWYANSEDAFSDPCNDGIPCEDFTGTFAHRL
jgi:hypothetical protein